MFERAGRNRAGEVYGCAGRHGRAVLLGAAFDCFSAEPDVGSVSNIRLRGRLATYSAQMCEGASAAGTAVRVMHLGERRLLLNAVAFPGAQSSLLTKVTDVEFGPGANVGWIAVGPDPRMNVASYAGAGCRTQAEWTCPVVLVEPIDSGPDIAMKSLASSGRFLYWSHAGSPRSWAP